MYFEMEYKYTKERFIQVLARDYYKGYEFFVVSYGTHPCAYVSIPEGKPYHEAKSWDDIVDIDCHGGCTYVENDENFKCIAECTEENTTVIGWDYGHYNDFSGIDLFPIPFETKKWTTKEMVAECKEVIEQLYFLEHPELYYK